MRATRFAIAPCVALLLSCSFVASAADTWTNPHPGIRRLFRTASGPLRIHALVVDLCAPGVGVRATATTERKRTVGSFAALVDAEAAINADFFEYTNYSTIGLSIGNGVRWTDTQDHDWTAMAAFGPQMSVFSPAAEVVSSPPAWMKNVVSGFPDIVRNGTVPTIACGDHFCARHPRTAIGFSRDRRTLTLVVIDGRTSASIGVTAKELANEMVSLGVYDAFNLDGGGSSTMWVKGNGVVNTPSDGSQRVVANHLAIFAKGSGMPTSCPADPEDAVFLDPTSTTTDIDGDGLADICARAAAGWRCHRSDGTSVKTSVAGPPLSDASGWNGKGNYGTIRMGDINGDGRADVCARAGSGMLCWLNGADDPIVGPAWSDAAGWNSIKYYSSIRLVDVTGDGLDDLCARGPDGVVCYPSTGTGFGAVITGPGWSDAGGWGEISHYGTIRFGDINGDGKADVCARAAVGMVCALSTGNGFAPTFEGPAWSNANGWNQLKHWSTIRMADIDGDGRADLCGRAVAGVVCHRSTGSGFGPQLAGPELSDSAGWDDWTNYMTIQMADVNGDGKTDLCARGNAGLRCYPSNGNGFEPSFAGPDWSDTTGWYDPKYFATIRFADINGDGRADVCGRGPDGIHCYLSNGTGFPTHVEGPTHGDSVGWGNIQYWSTIRAAGPKPPPVQPDAGSEPSADAAADSATDGPADPKDATTTDGTTPTDAETTDSDPKTDANPHDASGDARGGDERPWWSSESSDGRGGCGCRQTSSSSSSVWPGLLGLLGLLLTTRRHRRLPKDKQDNPLI